jgi:hypothetical protein
VDGCEGGKPYAAGGVNSHQREAPSQNACAGAPGTGTLVMVVGVWLVATR